MPVVPRIEMPPSMPSRAVECLFGHFLAAGNGNGHFQAVARRQQCGAGALDIFRDIAARYRVDRRAADLQAQPRLGDDADTGAALEDDLTATVGDAAHVRRQMRAIGGVRIVAGILDADRMGAVVIHPAIDDGEVGFLAVGQAADNLFRHVTLHQSLGGGNRGGGGIGTGSEPRAVAALASGSALADFFRRRGVGGCVRSCVR